MTIENLTEDKLREALAFCSTNFERHPVGYFVISEICKRFVDEYEDQGVPMDRFLQVNTLLPAINAAIQRPDDYVLLTRLVVAASRV